MTKTAREGFIEALDQTVWTDLGSAHLSGAVQAGFLALAERMVAEETERLMEALEPLVQDRKSCMIREHFFADICIHCGRLAPPEEERHKENCPVLAARMLLWEDRKRRDGLVRSGGAMITPGAAATLEVRDARVAN